MQSEKNNSSVNHLKIVRRRTHSPTTSSTYVGGNWETFPIDLIIEIFRRLPAKTIAICRCVSKKWDYLLVSPHFTKSFLTFSSTRPRLLFTFEFRGKWHLFSSPQPRNVGENVSVVAADYHMAFSGDWHKEVCLPINGFICLYQTQMLKGKMEMVPVICNPSTGQQVRLPRVRAKNNDLRSFIGYDPVENQLKVLCMTVTRYRRQTNSREHQLLTLGKGKLSWRKIECWFPHFPEKHRNAICINGILYYIARRSLTKVIACFHVKSEKFRFMQINDESSMSMLSSFMTLVNYKGKLGVLVYDFRDVDRLWVLDDAEKETWSKHLFYLPEVAFGDIRSIWATDTGEFVWAPSRWTQPFYVYYYNVERQSVRRVEIKGIEEKLWIGLDRPEAFFTFTNHVENVMFLQ